MISLFKKVLSASALAIVLSGVAFTASAANVTSAREGTVVTVQHATATSSQGDDPYGHRGYASYNNTSRVRSVVGGVLGGAIGAALGRHSDTGRYIGAAGGAAIGTAIGYHQDERAQQRKQYARRVREERARIGAQVIVHLKGGQTVAVFTHDSRFYPGMKVWLVGNDQLVPAH